MDVDELTAEKWTEYMKKGLCFNCGNQDILARIVEKRRNHWVTLWPGLRPLRAPPQHHPRRCPRRNSMLTFDPSQTRWTKKKKKRSTRKQRKRLFKLEKWVDVDFSIHWHPFCNSSNYKIEIIIYLDFNQRYRKGWNCRNLRARGQWSRRAIYRSKLHPTKRIQNKKTGRTDNSLQRGRNKKQTRNHHIIRWPYGQN